MTDIKSLTGPRVLASHGGRPAKLVVLLHGLGADGHDLISLAENWAPQLPEAEFISPNAPFPCDMAPWGHQWFSLQVFSHDAILSGVTQAAVILNKYLDDELEKRGLENKDLALVGFSQGTMLALHVALRRPQAVACVVGYSGTLAGPEFLAAEMKAKPPILLVHGDQDMVIPVNALFMAESALEKAGCAVKGLLRPGLAHGIDAKGIEEGGKFLMSHLGVKQATEKVLHVL